MHRLPRSSERGKVSLFILCCYALHFMSLIFLSYQLPHRSYPLAHTHAHMSNPKCCMQYSCHATTTTYLSFLFHSHVTSTVVVAYDLFPRCEVHPSSSPPFHTCPALSHLLSMHCSVLHYELTQGQDRVQ